MILTSVGRAQGCTDSWTGAAGDGLWSNGANWDQGRVPNSNDVACIQLASAQSYTVTLNGSATVAGLQLGATSGPAKQALDIAGSCGGDSQLTVAAGNVNPDGVLELTRQPGCSQQATLTVNGTLTNAGSLISDGELGGGRTITGTVQNGTTVNGGQPGTLTVTKPLTVQGNLTNVNGNLTVAAGQQLSVGSNYTQSPTGDLASQIASDGTFGSLNVTGTAALDGAVSATMPSPAPASSFAILTAARRTGTFASADAVASPSSGTYYLPTYSPTGASLALVTGSLSVSPASGSRNSSIAVTGAGWPGSDAVTIGFADSAGTITRTGGVVTKADGSFFTAIKVPDGAAGGAAQVWLESRFTGGTANRMSAQAFTVSVGSPTITAVQPDSGPASGNTVVKITGTDFAGATDVRFGATRASQFNVDSNTQVTATAPPGTGTVDVVVVTPAGTSATSAADRYTYVAPTAPPPSATPSAASPPAVAPGTVGASASQNAGFAGVVNPHGSATTAHFEYGLDDQYRPPGATGVIYDQVTPDQPVGSGSGDVPVVASVSGLVPNARYHVRLVATNAAGTSRGPDQTFTTPADAAPPPPVLGHAENVKPVGGAVFVVLAGKLIPLTEARQLPTGSILDTRQGTIALTAAAGAGKKAQTGTFTGAVFKLAQARAAGGLTTLSLLEGTVRGAPTYASCRAARAAGTAHAALSSRVLQTLRSRASGRFRTRGRYAAATVRGTQWTTADRCDGTLIAVQLHSVLVTDFVKHVSVIVSAGHSYLARAHP